MFTIILEMPPGIASEIVGISVAIIFKPRLIPPPAPGTHRTAPRNPPHNKKASLLFVEAGSGRNSIAVWGLSCSARHPQSGLSFTASPPGEAAGKGEARISIDHHQKPYEPGENDSPTL